MEYYCLRATEAMQSEGKKQVQLISTYRNIVKFWQFTIYTAYRYRSTCCFDASHLLPPQNAKHKFPHYGGDAKPFTLFWITASKQEAEKHVYQLIK